MTAGRYDFIPEFFYKINNRIATKSFSPLHGKVKGTLVNG
jgi:hypothetical protein